MNRIILISGLFLLSIAGYPQDYCCGKISPNRASDSDFDNTEVLVTTIADTEYGLLIIKETTGTEACIYLISAGAIEKISSDATFTVTKDNAGTYNVYFEDNVIKVQNNVGDNKSVQIAIYGL